MVKKRKLRSSEAESSNPNTEQEKLEPGPPQSEEEQHPQQIQEEQEQIEEQQEQINNEEEDEETEEQEQPQAAQQMEEDKEKEKEKEKESGEGQTVNKPSSSSSTEAAAAAEEFEEELELELELELEEEPVEKILQPFSKEQLVLVLKEAISKHPQFVEAVEKLADSDPARRKIFVHGLGWDSNTDTLTSFFSKYGDIEDCKAVCDKLSGKSKGYGFILFKHRTGARKALKKPQKKIGNRMTSCQLASAGPVPPTPHPHPPAPPTTTVLQPPVSELTLRKIFVSNVSAELDPQKLLEFFSKYGDIEDGPLGLDRQTGKPKGFALFVYKTVDGAKKALEEPHKNFEGHILHCQKAIDGPKQNKSSFYHHHQQQQQHHTLPSFHHHSHSHSSSSAAAARKDKAKYSAATSGGGMGTAGHHLMAPSGPALGYNPAGAAAPPLTPALGQALTALLATQGAGFGITNLLGGLGAPVNQGAPPMLNNAGYGNPGAAGGYAGYGNQPVNMQGGGYQNPQMGQGGPGRSLPGGAPYAGHGH